MAFTTQDLQNIEAAILALATGARVVQVTAGGKTVQYAVADLDKLRALRTEAQAQSGAVALRTYAVQGGRAG